MNALIRRRNGKKQRDEEKQTCNVKRKEGIKGMVSEKEIVRNNSEEQRE